MIPKRPDSTLDLIDALTSNDKAESVVQLSLNPLFRRKYSSITDVISNFPELVEQEAPRDAQERPQLEQKKLCRLIAKLCCTEPSELRPFHLFAADCSSYFRPHAKKLSDRSSVYAPNQAPGNKPIALGHQYANLAFLPEKTLGMPPWGLLLLAQRVSTEQLGHEVDISLMAKLLDDDELDFKSQLCVLTADTPHSSINCRRQVVSYDNLIMVARIRGNRNVYRLPGADDGKKRFGPKMNLGKKETHHTANIVEQIETTTSHGKHRIAKVEVWNDMLVRGGDGFNSDKHPFTLVKVTMLNSDGKEIYNRPLWLMVQGERRAELSPRQIFESYRQRFDIEHFFRFGKQRLLMDKFQTADTEHEENWWQLVLLAYVQLYLAKEVSQHLPYEWEKYLPAHQDNTQIPSPSHVMRDFPRIAAQIGTPAAEPKTRGIPPGRQKGKTQEPRPDHPVVYKKEKSKKAESDTSKEDKKQSTGFENQTDFLKPQTLDEALTSLKAFLLKIGVTADDFLKKASVVLTT